MDDSPREATAWPARPSRVVIFGATGVVGRRLVPLLLEGGSHVTAVLRDRRRAGVLPASPRLRIVTGSPLSPAQVLQPMLQGAEAVVNLATHIPQGWRLFLRSSWRDNDQLRRQGSRNVAGAAILAGVPRYIQESFGLAYADAGTHWVGEEALLQPPDYCRTVLDAERSAAEFGERAGAAVVLRFGAFYGPDADQTMQLVKAARMGRALLPGPAGAYLSSLSHDDAARAVAAALEAPPGTYNVSDDRPMTHEDVMRSLASELGIAQPRALPAWCAPLLGEPGRLLSRSVRLSNAAFRAATRWRPLWPDLAQGWRAMFGRPPPA